jgi:hypothetical protein
MGIAQNWNVCVEAPTLWASSVSHKYSVISFDRASSDSGESAAGYVPHAGPTSRELTPIWPH